MIAGVKDMRFQALMPDVLHWLGIKKVDKMVSMSDIKYDAIVKSGIETWRRYDIPGEFLVLSFFFSLPPHFFRGDAVVPLWSLVLSVLCYSLVFVPCRHFISFG